MNVIWITSDSFRRDHLGAYGNQQILTPSLDKLASQAMRFKRHYAAGFPTMPTRADHFTGRWTISNAMQWLERHYKEDFFLYIDTWDPHEPWDAPHYFTENYWPNYDAEIIEPIYGRWRDVPGFR